MADEHWATFSIYDHRTPLYRQALLLFDRVVIPVPTTPYGTLAEQELDALNADVEFLRSKDAAVPFSWDREGFDSWKESVASEALASTLNRDRLFATRLQVAEQAIPLKPAGVDTVVAVPIYGSAATFTDCSEEARKDGIKDVVLLEVVMPRLELPAPDVPLQTIIDLRESDSFREASFNLRKWQEHVLPGLLKEPEHRDQHLRAAAKDFDRWVTQYAEAIADARFAKVKTAVVSVLAVGAVLTPLTKPLIAALSAVASPLFSLRELRKPSWKVAAEKQCAPAAVVYGISKLD